MLINLRYNFIAHHLGTTTPLYLLVKATSVIVNLNWLPISCQNGILGHSMIRVNCYIHSKVPYVATVRSHDLL